MIDKNTKGKKRGGESFIHKLAKTAMCDYLNIGGKIMTENAREISRLRWITESGPGKFRFDIGGHDDQNVLQFGIEIYHTHRTSNLTARREIPWIEISALDVLRLLDVIEIPSYVVLRDLRCEEVDNLELNPQQIVPIILPEHRHVIVTGGFAELFIPKKSQRQKEMEQPVIILHPSIYINDPKKFIVPMGSKENHQRVSDLGDGLGGLPFYTDDRSMFVANLKILLVYNCIIEPQELYMWILVLSKRQFLEVKELLTTYIYTDVRSYTYLFIAWDKQFRTCCKTVFDFEGAHPLVRYVTNKTQLKRVRNFVHQANAKQ